MRKAITTGLLAVGLMLGAGTPITRAADASHPYSSVNHQVDAGNNTGDSETDRLNQQQLDKVSPQRRAQRWNDQQSSGSWGAGRYAAVIPPYGSYPPPPYAVPPPCSYAAGPYAWRAYGWRPYGWRPWLWRRVWVGAPYPYWRPGY